MQYFENPAHTHTSPRFLLLSVITNNRLCYHGS